MKNSYFVLLLFLAQVYLTFRGTKHFGNDWSAVVLFSVWGGIAVWWLRVLLSIKSSEKEEVSTSVSWRKKAFGAFVGMLGIGFCYEELRKLFVKFPLPTPISDVLPQIETLFTRFAKGEFPYQPVDMGHYSPYPVYMPLHWLPIGISKFFQMDIRWSGYALLVAAAGVFGWFVFRRNRPLPLLILAALLPSIPLWGYILWGEADIPVSYELVVAAYYLVLAASLSGRNLAWVTIGLILCLLSRYTLVFWLPFFAILLWQNTSFRQNTSVWISVAASALLLYFFPFFMKDPTILAKGIAYHNGAAIDEWRGYGDPPVSWTMEQGIHFARHLKMATSGGAKHQVFVARAEQAATMLLLLFAGLWGWRRWRERIHFLDFSLLMLYLFVLFFYFFGPLTYRYYLIVPMMISAVICGRVLASGGSKRTSLS
jgi:hypothetical protein